MRASSLLSGLFVVFVVLAGCKATVEPTGDAGTPDTGMGSQQCGQQAGSPCCGSACNLGLECGRNNRCCVQAGSGGCVASRDCCSGLTCDNGTCVAPSGGGCSTSDTCRTGYRCDPTTHACKPATDTSCGGNGQDCCTGRVCDRTLTCSSISNTCVGCGGENQPCCAQPDRSGGGRCNEDRTCTTPPCPVLTCQSNVCRKENDCGDEGTPCCTTGTQCYGVTECDSGTCRRPTSRGGAGQPCLAGNRCDAGYLCNTAMNKCEISPACDNDGESCCAGDLCAGGLTCEADKCSSCTATSGLCIPYLSDSSCCEGSVCRPSAVIPRCCRAQGSSCTTSADCCGFMQCESGVCGGGVLDGYCFADSDCAPTQHCDWFTCTDGTNECIAADDDDGNDAVTCEDEGDCCDGLACSIVVGEAGQHCCAGAGGSCNDSYDCCGQMLCDEDAGTCSPQPVGEPCLATEECVEGATCIGGSCIETTNECFLPGTECTVLADCCGYRGEEGTVQNCRAEDNDDDSTLYCCQRQAGNNCDDDEDCCGGMKCEDDVCACVPDGEPCVDGEECCEGLSCFFDDGAGEKTCH